MRTGSLNIAETAWREAPVSEKCGQGRRLFAEVGVNGWWFHAEAWEVADDESQVQRATDPECEEQLGAIHAALGCDGPFQTLSIGERRYVVVIYPTS